MSNAHTPEPWRVGRTFSTHNAPIRYWETLIENEIGENVCKATGATQDESEANARRIVACMNACAGIDIDFLERIPLTAATAQLEKLTEQRDTLLAALKKSRATLERANTFGSEYAITDTIWNTKHQTLFDFMDEAIASIESPTQEQAA